MPKKKRFPHHFAMYIRTYWRSASSFRLVYRPKPGGEYRDCDFELAVAEVLSETPEERTVRDVCGKKEARQYAGLFVEAAEEWGREEDKRRDYSIVARLEAGDDADPCDPGYRYDPEWDDSEIVSDGDDAESSGRAAINSEMVGLLREMRSLFSDSHKWMEKREALGAAQLRNMFEHAEHTVKMQMEAAKPLMEMRQQELQAQTEVMKAQEFNKTLNNAVEHFGPALTTYAQAEYIKAQQGSTSGPDLVDDDPVREAFLDLVNTMTRGELAKLATHLGESGGQLLSSLVDTAHDMDAGELKAACRVLITELGKADLNPQDFRIEILTKAMHLKKAA